MSAASWLAFAHELADAADAMTLPAFTRAKSVTHKHDGSVVTMTDVGVERTLRTLIAEQYPDHAFLGEEDGLTGDPDAPRWIVDPVDGTTNFVQGNPIWATLIALQLPDERAGESEPEEVLGVVSAPALARRWDGLVDGATRRATCLGEPIRVSERGLADAEVSFGGLNWFWNSGHAVLVDRLTGATRRQRGYGDFWHHCLVAEGVIEVAVEAAVSPWDLAAVKAVVEAAGGRFTDLDGRATIHGGSALSTNGLVHDQVLALVDPDPSTPGVDG